MNDLIYFSRSAVIDLDFYCTNSNFKYSQWFNLEWPGANHIVSRVNKIETPWSLASTLYPMPTTLVGSEDFSFNMDLVANNIISKITASGRRPYFYYSGGIDSTAIMVSILKNAPQEFLNQLVVLHDNTSIEENAYFYHYYIKPRLTTQDLHTFEITAENYKTVAVIDGECGNQLMGSWNINALSYQGKYELLNKKIDQINFAQEFPTVTSFNIDLIKESTKYSPVPIENLFDFLWWANFNFKFQDVLLRRTITLYTKNLTADQSQKFFSSGIFRFYTEPELQIWSMLSKDLRHQSIQQDNKLIPKQYIYNYDKNSLWFAYKREQMSGPFLFRTSFQTLPIVAVDSNWQKYSAADRSVRQKLGQILERN
jgi:hypothetical protein